MKFIKLLTLLTALICFQCAFSQDQMFDICPLLVGEEIPEVSLMDEDGGSHSLKDLTTVKPTVLIFYRGAWCGYCTKHLAELNDIKNEIDEMGFQIFGITVDQDSKLIESKKKSEDEIPVYSDAKLEAIKAFGLDWKLDDELYQKYKTEYELDIEDWSGEDHHSLPVPGVYVIKDDKVAFQYVNPNYKTRLSPETLLAILKSI